MPYKDIDQQRAYNREWAKHSASAATTPLARRTERVIAERGPISRGRILDVLGPVTTYHSLGVTLNRLHRAGRIRKLGDKGGAAWVIAK